MVRILDHARRRTRLLLLLLVMLGSLILVAASGVQAAPHQASPPNGTWHETIYYSDASHTTMVGYWYHETCSDTYDSWGTVTAYVAQQRGYCR